MVCVRSRLFDKLRDLGLAGFDEEKINSVLEQLLNGPVVLGREHFELPCDFGMEVRADEALAYSAVLAAASPLGPCLGLGFDNPLLGGGKQNLALCE